MGDIIQAFIPDTHRVEIVMEDRLQYILSNVNNWLKFAEAKNAALFAADSALVAAILKILDGTDFPHPWMPYYIGLVVFQFMFSAVVSLSSFIPQVKLPWLGPKKRPQDADNLLFFGDIAHYEPTNFLRKLYAQQGQELGKIDALEEDYAEQIVINSRITLRKYGYFTLALYLALSAISTPVLALIIYLFVRGKSRRS